MRWQPDHPPLNPNALGPLAPELVLVEYQGPRVYACRGRAGGLLFAYQCDEDGVVWRYTVVPCSDRQLARFVSGELTVAQMLSSRSGWVADIRDGADIESVWEVAPTALPDCYRPTSNPPQSLQQNQGGTQS